MSEYVDDPALNARIRARAATLAADNERNLTLAERLMVSALDQTITVSLQGVEVALHAPFTQEIDLISRASEEGDSETLCEILGALCIDPSLDAGFFRSGAIAQPDLKKLILAISGVDERTQAAIENFRKKRGR